MTTHKWLTEATSKIYFGPEREAVRRELAEHLLDRQERHRARGLTAQEAEAAAVADMGDPSQLAVELGRLHRPWWGWLWRISQALLAASLLTALALTAATGAWTPPASLRPVDFSSNVGGNGTLGPHDYRVDILEEFPLADSVQLSGYRISVPQVWLEEYERGTEDGGIHREYRMVLHIRSQTWRFWAPSDGSPWMVSHTPPTGGDSAGERSFPFAGDQRTIDPDAGPGATQYLVAIVLEGPEPPDWLRLPLGFSGDVLRLDLKERRVVTA